MAFLLEKYKPCDVNDFSFNVNILEQLLHVATYDDIPHIIISGPAGGGKKTILNKFLEAIYDPDVNCLTKCTYSVSGSSAKKDVEILQSNYHIIIEPTSTNHDKYILQEIIKQYAMHKTFNFFKTQRNFKTIVILNIENLANNSQAALRRTMELYAKTCRFIMVCNNLSKIFDPLKSRCRIFCVPLATSTDINNIITHISIMENILITNVEKQNIINYSEGKLKKAIWMLDAIKYDVDPIILLDKAFVDVVALILRTLTVNKDIIKLVFEGIRANIYSIWITNIGGSVIITTILDRLINIIGDDGVCIELVQIASESEFNLIHGRRDIAHIDTYVAQIIKVCFKNKVKLLDIIEKNKSVKKIEFYPKNNKTTVKKDTVKKPQIRKLVRKNTINK
jgi:replication factor C subunit 3/5